MRRINLFAGSILMPFFVILLAAGWNLGIAQVTGSISGVVTDQTGARLPGVKVTLHHVETGRVRTTLTDEAGRYDVPSLAVGSYEASAELAGFHTTVRKGITLTVASREVVDLSMQVGEVAEQVTVTGEAPLVNLSSAAVGEIVDDKKVRDLPLNGRDVSQLILLQTEVTTPRNKVHKMITSNGLTFNISGQRDISNVILLDGTDIIDARGAAGGAGGALTGVETVREFRVLTDNYSAEYGKALGGVITAVTKSGTNQFHGTAFEFLRNNHLDARNFFDPGDVPQFKRNQFGGALGGPIRKDKTFFFGSYEGTRERLGMTVIKNVPSAGARQGFIGSQNVGLNPAVVPYLNVFPVPNGKDFGTGIAQNLFPFSQPLNEDFFTTRLDQQFSPNDTFFVRYTRSDSNKETTASDRQANFPELNAALDQFATVEETHIFSPHLLNTLRVGVARTTPIQGEANPSTAAPPFVPGKTIGTLRIGGLDAYLGSNENTPRNMLQNLFEYSDDVTRTIGRHAIKMGMKVQRYQQNTSFANRSRGVYFFRTLADFLQGNSYQFQAATPDTTSERSIRFTTYGFYTQDDLQLTSRLALNLGLRYEFTTVPIETHGRFSGFRDMYKDSALTVGAPFQNPGLLNFSPRVGLSWDPTGSGKTAIRAGGAIFYQPVPTHAFFFANIQSSTPPFAKVATLLGTAQQPLIFPASYSVITRPGAAISFNAYSNEYKISQPKVNRFNFNIQRQIVPDLVVNVGYAGALGRDLQRLENFNTRIPKIVNGRITFNPSDPLRNPYFQEMRFFHTDADSYYHGLSLSARKRFSHGLQLQASYTWSKSIDDASTTTGGDFPGGSTGDRSVDFPASDRGLSSFDTRHNFVFNFSYDLPFGAGSAIPLSGVANGILGGWQFSGIVTAASGLPASPQVARTLDWDGDGNTTTTDGRPDLKPGQKIKYPGTPDQWFDPNAFVLGPRNSFGNAGRNIIIGPGVQTFDFSLVKNTAIHRISEAFNIQFRAELFNIFNRANFGQPDNTIFADASGKVAGSAGVITSPTTSSRQIQFGLKVQF